MKKSLYAALMSSCVFMASAIPAMAQLDREFIQKVTNIEITDKQFVEMMRQKIIADPKDYLAVKFLVSKISSGSRAHLMDAIFTPEIQDLASANNSGPKMKMGASNGVMLAGLGAAVAVGALAGSVGGGEDVDSVCSSVMLAAMLPV